MNRNGIKPESLQTEPEPVAPEFITSVGDDSITRFDHPDRKKGRGRGHGKGGNGNGGNGRSRNNGHRGPRQGGHQGQQGGKKENKPENKQ